MDGSETLELDGSETLERAIAIAVRAHAGRLYPARDGERGPYVLHLFRVMLAVARQVKLADLADNLATNLALPPSDANQARIARYEAAIARLGG